jgi:hypothetical protein
MAKQCSLPVMVNLQNTLPNNTDRGAVANFQVQLYVQVCQQMSTASHQHCT